METQKIITLCSLLYERLTYIGRIPRNPLRAIVLISFGVFPVLYSPPCHVPPKKFLRLNSRLFVSSESSLNTSCCCDDESCSLQQGCEFPSRGIITYAVSRDCRRQNPQRHNEGDTNIRMFISTTLSGTFSAI